MISPYRDMRAYASERLAPFVEVFVDCPLDECERRDPKGLYARAREGDIPMYTGVSDGYEPPEAPEIVLPPDRCSVEEGVQLALNRLKELSLLT